MPALKSVTLVDIFCDAVSRNRDAALFTYLLDGEEQELTLSRGELDAQARAVARELCARGLGGQRVLLLYAPGLDFITAFLGCLYAGAVAVPAYPPDPSRLARTLPRLQAVVGNCQPALVLTTSPLLALAAALFAHAPVLSAVPWAASDTWSGVDSGDFRPPRPSPADVAFIQYTSGSTATPKGVTIGHDNLTSQLHQLKEWRRSGEHSIAVSWLPFYHDMGLIGTILHPMFNAGRSILMSPLDFLKRPARWLRAISKYRADASPAPNFALDLCVRKVTAAELVGLDFSCLITLLVGSEPSHEATLRRFYEMLAPHGLRPNAIGQGYGMAEGVLVSTGAKPDTPLRCGHFDAAELQQGLAVPAPEGSRSVRSLVSCGVPMLGQRIEIVDPATRMRCAPGRVGEIWIAGPNIARGYWNRPEDTAATFGATLADTGEGPFLRSGDLGFTQDGELYVTSRIKDLIIIAGKNHHPQDIEHTVGSCDGRVRRGCSAAFSIEQEEQERLVVVVEVETRALPTDATREAALAEIVEAIRRAVREEHDLAVYAVALLAPGQLAKTSSGKIMRQASRADFLAERLEELARSTLPRQPLPAAPPAAAPDSPLRTEPEIAAWLSARLGERCGLPPQAIASELAFVQLGLDSKDAVSLAGELEAALRRPLPSTLLYDYPNVSALARFLAGTAPALPAAASPAAQEPIAIIAMGCRYPGGVQDPESFWQLLEQEVDAIEEVPRQRWDIDAYYDQDPQARGKMSSRWGGFLPDIDRFDPAFFGISPREAVSIDPQQRLLLETSWEALERAGLTLSRLLGSNTGVYMGICGSEYQRLTMARTEDIDAYSLVGTAPSTSVGRLSYWLGLSGPNVALDTACSSSLVAVHLACQALRSGECSLALAGGVNVLLSPEPTVYFSRLGAMSPTGRCHSFSDDADGYVRSEGCGVVVLKRLRDALRDGDRIEAVIRGSAINQDGRSNGLTAPNGPAQRDVIQRALTQAGVLPAEVDYVEAHGTGTPLGDPIELHALAEVLGHARDQNPPLVVGSVKTNLGHTEAAAGVAGLLKTVLCLQHGKIPRSLHFRAPNPQINWSAQKVEVAKEVRPWPTQEGKRRLAGVSSFGFSGTNAHVVLEAAPLTAPGPRAPHRAAELLVLSGRSEAAVSEQAQRLREHLQRHPELALTDIAYSLCATRSEMEHRLAVVASSVPELQKRLEVAAKGGTPSGSVRSKTVAGALPKVVFVFPGQGSQWLGMGQALLQQEPVFHAALSACDRAIQSEAGFSVLAELSADAASSQLARIEIVQPLLFAIGVALAALWRSWGIEPDAVLGHSQGEIAAAHMAGALSVEDAVAVVCRRSRLLCRISGQGEMAMVELSADATRSALSGYADELSVAASNGPSATVIAGNPVALSEVLSQLTARGVFCRRIKVDYASHSPQVEPLLPELAQALSGIKPREAALAMRSTVTGALMKGPELSARYWTENLRQPVLFGTAVQELLGSGHGLFIEMSPHPLLMTAVEELQEHARQRGVAVGSLRREQPERATLLLSLAALWCQGYRVDWQKQFPHGGLRVPLPTYAWQRQRYWIEPPSRPLPVASDPLAECFYQLEWPQRPRVPADAAGNNAAAFLILADQGGVGTALAKVLSSHGHACTLCSAQASVAAIRDELRLRQDLRGVVYLWGLDAVANAAASGSEVQASTERAIGPLLSLLRELATRADAPRLWIVTRGACAVDSAHSAEPCQAALWGLGRVIGLEHPALWGGLVDLEVDGGSAQITALAAELRSPDGEDSLAFRRGRRHAARLVAAPVVKEPPPLTLSPDGSYLVTGGLSGIGLQVARWLMGQGARHLVLTSRRGLQAPGAAAATAELQAQGAQVHAAAVDVADLDAMATLLATVKPPLRGVLHCAGVGEVGPVCELTESQVAATLRPKVAGSWVLHRLLADQPLELFVLFSSGAAVWGGAGQAAYAAANAFLDALAHYRRARSLPAQSINWGLWANAGMSRADAQAQLARIGMYPMLSSAALAALARLVRAGTVQCTVTRTDWTRFAPVYEVHGRRNLLQELHPQPTSTAEPEALRSWRELAEPEARAAVRQLVRKTVAEVLGFGADGTLDEDRGFAAQGLDSLMAVQLRTRLEKALGQSLSSTVAFDHPTVNNLTAYLLTKVLKLEQPSSAPLVHAQERDAAIAIIGAACRFPGGITDPDTYWEVLAKGAVVIEPAPAERFDAGDLDIKGGFLRELGRFDAEFFQISPREVMSLDPQQRLLLEVGWEALERAGQDPSALRESATGVFVGMGANEYAERLQGTLPDAANAYVATGNMPSILAGRLSYFLGLRGPSLSVDTACSSSLVALHLGCQSLRQSECAMALVGGVNLMLSPRGFALMAQMRALSPDGRCQTFSAEANGMVRAEGCAVIVLKRLPDAQRDGDRIIGVIRGTAINHDGASSGLTVPNGPAQQAVLEQALAHAGVPPAAVDYVECHGTGTKLGDPIEVQALGSVYGQNRPSERPLVLGAAKANLGHLEAAAGLVGVLKVLLALQHQEIPAQPEFAALNPNIPWTTLPVEVARRTRPWRAEPGKKRLAGVSAFGFSGTNAHVVIEEAPQRAAGTPAPIRAAELIVLSGRSEAAVNEQAGRLREHLLKHPQLGLQDVAYSLCTTRSQMEHRLALVVSMREQLLAMLASATQGHTPPGAFRGAASSGGKLAFLFSGQGAQLLGMGQELYAAWPVFREALDRCIALLDPGLDRPLKEVMWAGPDSAAADLLQQTGYTQPALFALEYAMQALWNSWGVEPDLLLGHSIGEIVAACVAQGLSLPDAARLCGERARLMQQLDPGGAMAAIDAAEADVQEALRDAPGRVGIAAVNAPRQVVISGDHSAVRELAERFAKKGVRSKALAVSHAFHSGRMEPMLPQFREAARALDYKMPRRKLVSNVSGKLWTGAECGAEYWVKQVREPVRFLAGAEELHRAGARRFVEMGPQGTLVGLVEQCLPAQKLWCKPTMRKGRAEMLCVLEALAELWCQGGTVRWQGLHPEGARRVELPTYPWQHHRDWLQAPKHPSAAGVPTGHPLLGARLAVAGTTAVFEGVLGIGSQPWLGDHRVAGRAMVPGTGVVELIYAAAAIAGQGGPQLAGLVLQAPLVLPETGARRVQVALTETPEKGRTATVYSQPMGRELGQPWTQHASAQIDRQPSAAPKALDLSALRARCRRAIDPTTLYARLSAMGYAYGPAFQGLRSLWQGAEEALAEVALDAAVAVAGYGLHPALLDAAFHALAAGFAANDDLWLPFAIDQLVVHQQGAGSAWVHVRFLPSPGDRGLAADVTLADPSGALIAQVTGLRLQRAAAGALVDEATLPEAFYRLDWQEAPPAQAPAEAPDGSWVVVATAASTAAAELARQLHGCVQVEPGSLVAALSAIAAAAPLVCLWERKPEESSAEAAQRVAIEGLKVVQALAGRAPRQLLWVTRSAVAVHEDEAVEAGTATIWGLGRTLFHEHPELGCRLVDLGPSAAPAAALLGELAASPAENQVAWRDGRRYVARLVRAERACIPADAADYQLRTRSLGTLAGLHLEPTAWPVPAAGEVLIEVRAAGLNFRDVLSVLGMYPGAAGPLGAECSGVVIELGPGVQGIAVGDAVMALAPGTFRKRVAVDARLLARIPEGLSFEQAAAIPIAFLTAWYALYELGELKAGERVLVHAAAGGVGMAAVQLAHHRGAEVYATASPAKWEAVRAMGVQQVAGSRSLDFVADFRQASGGRGVDLVLNSLAGEFVDASISLLSAGGRMLEIGKTDVREPEQIAVAHPGVRYHAFDLGVVGPEKLGQMLASIADGLSRGEFRPLPVQAFPITQAQQGFRFMAQARHVGKLVLVPPQQPVPGNATVLVSGGLGGLGLHIARWLARQHVAHLLLIGRRGMDTPGAALAVAELQAMGARVTVRAVDVADQVGLKAVLESVPAELPLRGVVHVAGVLDDGVIEEQTADRFQAVLSPKVAGTFNLHLLTAAHELTLFVLLSSAAGLLGSVGQSSYAAANAFVDALAAHRRALNLPGQSLAFGAWSGSGMAAALDASQRARWPGLQWLTPAEGIRLWERALTQPEAHLGIMPIDLRALQQALGAAVPPLWWSLLTRPATRSASSVSWSAALLALPAGQRKEAVRAAVQTEVARVLAQSSPAAVPVDRPLKELGMDSLMAVELRNALGQRLGKPLPATLAFDYPTVDALAEWLLAQVLPSEAKAALPPAQPAREDGTAIAIIGVGCRFPGGIHDPESFWKLLEHGVDAIEEVPAQRWDRDAYYDKDPQAPGKMVTRWGGFLPDIDSFEPEFFGISPREATRIDPQQRLLLEVSWEALERAGQTTKTLFGSDTGVYMGICGNEYQELLRRSGQDIDPYALLGTAHSTSVGRLSYWLGLKGPNIPVDTACSSSLVAVHLACQALRNRECSLALAGGVNVVLSPEGTMYFSRLGAMSPTGRCRSFADDADGYVRSEGCGVVVLKRLSDALRDRDPILAVIRGSAVNQDGRSNGLTAPNGPAQREVIERALQQAGTAPTEIDYVEAHGTGTPLGDPIELQALGEGLGAGRGVQDPVVVGSVKSNFGHTEAAAGVAGLLKVVLSLQRGMIPKSLHFHRPNRHVPWKEIPIAVAQGLSPWPTRPGKRRLAGVSAFGFSGTNAHVVVEEAPPRREDAAAADRAAELLVLSGRSEAAVVAQAARLHDDLKRHSQLSLLDIGYSLSATRSEREHRLALVCSTRDELHVQLRSAAQANPPPGAIRGLASADGGKLAFLFSGQGAQVPGMGKPLYAAWPVFQAAIDRCAKLFDDGIERPLKEVMWSDPGSGEAALLDQTGYTQPALFTLEYALFELCRSWGLEPDFVAGHSIGELVAAVAAGVLTLEDAARLCAARARLMQKLPGGAMAAIEAEESAVEKELRENAGRVWLAAVNGPKQTVISGEPSAVSELSERFAQRGVKTKRLSVSHAFHSGLMEPMLDAFRNVAQALRYRRPERFLMSTLTGTAWTERECTAEYWVKQVREPVRFAQVVKELHEEGARRFLELGPQGGLVGLVDANLPGAKLWLQGMLRRGRAEAASVLEALGGLWCGGAEVNWKGVYPQAARRVELPTYPWQRRRYWMESPARAAARVRAPGGGNGHPLIGRSITLSTQTPAQTKIWEVAVTLDGLPWLADHRVQDAVVLPGSAYVEMALAAGQAVLREGPYVASELAFLAPLSLSEESGAEVQVVATEEQPGHWQLQVASRQPDQAPSPFLVHARGRLLRSNPAESPDRLDLAALRSRLQEVAASELYEALRTSGLHYGAAFQGVRELWCGPGEALGRVQLPAEAGARMGYALHPAMLDACLQVTAGAIREREGTTPWVPVAIDAVRLLKRSMDELYCHVRLSPPGAESSQRLRADLRLFDRNGEAVAELTGLVLQRLPGDAREREQDGWFVAPNWERASVPAPRLPAGRWLLVGEDGEVGSALGRLLERAGHAVVQLASPVCAAGLRGSLQAAFAEKTPLGVVHFGDPARAENLDAELLSGCDSVLATVQALVGVAFRDPPRLWLVTRGAQAVGGAMVRLQQAPLVGLRRVIALEHGELRCRHIDLDPAPSPADADALAAELLADVEEEETAWRSGERWVARLGYKKPASGPPFAPAAAGSYLISGGLGGLGLSVAGWLAERGAGHLVLVGRSGARSAEQQAAVAALRDKGARVTVAAADVAQRAELAALFAEVRASGMPLRGIIHAAGVLDDGLLLQQTPERVRAVLAPKILGAHHLHELSRELPLQFFVLYSSAAGLLGTPGQGSYAAANAFLDALAHHRRAQGLPALSIDWGPFAEVGLAAASAGARLMARGLRSLTPAEGLEVLGRLLAGDAAQLGVVPFDLQPWAALHPAAAASRVSRLLLSRSGVAPGAPASRALHAQLAQAPPGEHAALIEDYVRQEVAYVLRLDLSEVSRDAAFASLGGDSLMAVELRNRLQAALGLPLDATLLFKHRSVAALAAWLLSEWLSSIVTQDPAEKTSPRSDAAEGDESEFEEVRI